MSSGMSSTQLIPLNLHQPDYVNRAMREAGVSRDSHVIVYDRDRMRWAARVWWTLRVSEGRGREGREGDGSRRKGGRERGEKEGERGGGEERRRERRGGGDRDSHMIVYDGDRVRWGVVDSQVKGGDGGNGREGWKEE